MADHIEPTIFLRHNRPLRTVLLESQVWFCARDLGRLMGWPLNERTTRKLDEDQRRVVLLAGHCEAVGELMVSESGMYVLLAQHYHAENRGLRQWITKEVVTSIRDEALPHNGNHPSLSFLQWPGLSVSLLHWQSEPWIRLRDMPRMLPHAQGQDEIVLRKAQLPWWRAVRRGLWFS